MAVSLRWCYRPSTAPRYQSAPTHPWDDPGTPQSRPLSSAPRVTSARRPPSHDALLERLCRPTMSSRFRHDCPRLCVSSRQRYLTADNNKYIWSKMAIFKDCQSCLYTRYGVIKSSTKL